MMYLDYGATAFRKPPEVARAVQTAMATCANPGRGGYPAAVAADRQVYSCRERAANMFDCQPEQVVFTANCTHGLNIAISSLVKPGAKVIISGFEHNAVRRPLHALGARITVAGRRLFNWEDTLEDFAHSLAMGADAAVFTYVSNVFGYILPVEEMARLCCQRGIPFVIDAAQAAGTLPVKLGVLGADFIAMPGHKGLLGPQGTGLLLCKGDAKPLMYGGTGSESLRTDMPDTLPERLETGTLNVPGIAGLNAALEWLERVGIDRIAGTEHAMAKRCAGMLKELGVKVFAGDHQGGTVSFVPQMDCEEVARRLARWGIGVRAGLHCAPLAHESAGTLETGTVRVSFGPDGNEDQISALRSGILACGVAEK